MSNLGARMRIFGWIGLSPLALVAAFLPSPLLAQESSTHQIEALKPKVGTESPLCSADGQFCVALISDKDQPARVELRSGTALRQIELPAPAVREDDEESSTSLWPMRIALAGTEGNLVGLVTEQRVMYSGGGGSASQLHLYQIRDNAPAQLLLSVPWGGGQIIRACFSDKDRRQRAGVCHDQYEFTATLAIIPEGTERLPSLRYETRATSFPGKVSREADSLAAPKLRRKDLVTHTDPECSVTRDFRIGGAVQIYQPDQPLPDCSHFTAP